MTVLGLKLARRVNAVSSLHGEVSRAMWRGLYPDRPEDAVPIGHVTNGVHVPSWLAPQMRRLYDRHLGVGWQRQSGAAHTWSAIETRGRRRAVGDAPQPERAALQFCATPRARAGRTPQRTGRGFEAAGQSAFTRCLDHRICAPLCHLQARQPVAEGFGAAGGDGERRQAPGSVCFCRQGASTRRAGKESAAADCADDARR